jgi:hypothetical protein
LEPSQLLSEVITAPDDDDDDDDDECSAIGGMLGTRNTSTLRKPAPVPLCPPQIPHDLTRARTQAAAVGTARPNKYLRVDLNLM